MTSASQYGITIISKNRTNVRIYWEARITENESLRQGIVKLQKQVQAEQREQKNMENRHNSEIVRIDRNYQQKIAGYDNRLKQIDTYFPIVRSEEHTLNSSHNVASRMPSSA